MTDATVVIEAPDPETVAEAETVAVETVEAATEAATEAAVEIARIEADRDVTIAAIAADTETAHAADMDERVAACQAQIQQLTEAMELRLSSIQQRLIELGEMMPPPQNPPSDAADGQKESPAETVVEVVETPPAEPVRKKRGHRWI